MTSEARAFRDEVISRRRVTLVSIGLVVATIVLVQYGILHVFNLHDHSLVFNVTTQSSPDNLKPDTKWGDEYDFSYNILSWIRSQRGEIFIQDTLTYFVLCFVIHLIARDIFRAYTFRYSAIHVRERFFLSQKYEVFTLQKISIC